MTEKIEKVETEVKKELKVEEIIENKEINVDTVTKVEDTKSFKEEPKKSYRETKKDYRKDNREFRHSSNRDDYKFRKMRRKVCLLCKEKEYVLDYKDAETIKRFINEKGKILPRRATGTCAKHQREIAQVIKRARHIAVIPYIID